MKTVNRLSILKWAVVALVVLNLSTLATIFYQRRADLISNSEDTVEINGNTVSSADKFSGRYFRDKLRFTTEQMHEFQKFNPEFRNKAKEINIRLEELRHAMLDEMVSSDPDTMKLNEMSGSIGEQHRELKKITFGYYLDLKSICNPDQQLLLKELFSETFVNDSRMDSINRGSKGNRRYRGGFTK